MSIILQILIYVCVFTTSYMILNLDSSISRKRIKELKRIKIGSDIDKESYNMLNLITNIPFYKTQEEIDKTGNSLGFSPMSYLISKIVLTIIPFIITMYFFNNIIISLVFGVLGFFVIDILLNLDKNMEVNMIRLDLADVTNQIKFNANGERLEIAIANAVTSISKSKKLKKEYLILSSEIITTGRAIEALEKFKRKFDYEEVDEFVFMLEQAINTGVLEAQLNGFLMLIEADNNKYIRGEIAKSPRKVDDIGVYITMAIISIFLVVTVTMAFNNANAIFK